MTMEQCLSNCSACHQHCTSMVQHCLGMGGEHASADHIRLLQDCAQICQTSADFMLRKSPLHILTFGACAEICQQCAHHCERLANGDTTMMACAQACRDCAASCREMSMATRR